MSIFFRKVIVSFLGMGYLPVAPGSWGALLGAIFAGLIGWWCGEIQYFNVMLIVLSVIFYFVGVLLGKWAVEYYKSDDPRCFVLDEVVGMFVSILFIPFVFDKWGGFWGILFVQYILFRIFDVIKPFPVKSAEKFALGWGIMSDDVIAGIYANVLGQFLMRLIW